MNDNNRIIRPLSFEILDIDKIKSINKDIFFDEDISIVNHIMPNEMTTVFQIGELYRIADARIMNIRKGRIHVRINLEEITLYGGTLVFIPKGTLVEIDYISEDADAFGTFFGNNFFENNFTNFEYFQIIKPDSQEWLYINDLFALIWRTAQKKDYYKQTLQLLLKAYIANTYFLIQKQNLLQEDKHLSRTEEVFQKFLLLLNKYGAKQRTIKFYADKLCLSSKYFSSIIKKQSGQTVVQWIDKQVIMEAKVLLKHSNMTIYQISDELNFPNPSFFTKFFKRLTNFTPKEYRNSK